MWDDDINFSEIQKIFADRDKKQEKEAQERRSQLTLIDRRSELRDEPAYENMHAKNIHVTEKGYQAAKNKKLSLKVGVVVLAVVVLMAIVTALGIHSMGGDKGGSTGTTIGTMDTGTHNNGQTSMTINPEQIDLSNLTVVLRKSTSNVNKVVSVTERELTEMGVENTVVGSNEDIVSIVEEIKNNKPNGEVIVINVDGVTNKTKVDNVIMTNYNNDARSADAIALAINNGCNDIYQIESEIRCGKKTSDGNRAPVSVEKTLLDAGHSDVICLTIAPSSEYIDSEIEYNNLATSIAEGVIRYASLSKEEQQTDYIKRTEYGDTVSNFAVENGVSESFIRSENKDAFYNGILAHNSAVLVKEVPTNLKNTATVVNKSITTNVGETGTAISYYEVKPGDTLSEIAEQLGVKQSDLVVPSGDNDVIHPGDKIGYEKEVGKILVSKSTSKSK